MASTKTIRVLWIIFILVLAGTLVAEFFIDYHQHFGVDGWRFFHAGFGFLACAGIIVFSKLIGFLLKRSTVYYEEKHHGE